LPESLERLEQALVLFRGLGGQERGVGKTLKNIASIHWKLERYDLSMAVYREALEIHRQIGDRVGEGDVLHNIGLVLYAQRHMDEALASYQAAIDAWAKVGH